MGVTFSAPVARHGRHGNWLWRKDANTPLFSAELNKIKSKNPRPHTPLRLKQRRIYTGQIRHAWETLVTKAEWKDPFVGIHV